MRSSIRTALVGATAAATIGAALFPAPSTAGASSTRVTRAAAQDYVVLYAAGASRSAARAAIAQAGGTLVRDNAKVGYALVRSADASFVDRVAQQSVLERAARNRPIGYAPKSRPKRDGVERRSGTGTGRTGASAAVQPAAVGTEPLAGRQWDMRQIGATPTGSYRV